jgi:2OG-Fe(II) oxygenase superfamily
MSIPETFFTVNLVEAGLIDDASIAAVTRTVLHHGQRSVLRGGSTTSLEPKGINLWYRLLDGEQIGRLLPWLDELYRGPICALAGALTRRKTVPSWDGRSGINVNLLEGIGSRYEWHVDSNPLTGVLYLTDFHEKWGGRLLFRDAHGDDTAISGTQGDLFVFDARHHAHAVERLRTWAPRVSVPMNFFEHGTSYRRPVDLDSYLYADPLPTPVGAGRS